MEALVLQQEIAEELERERKRNQKEIAALQHTTSTLTRQRDEAQRVVLHLRSLINAQSHHMEHIIRSISNAPELSEYIEKSFEDLPEAEEEDEVVHVSPKAVSSHKSRSRRGTDGEDVTPEMENHLLSLGKHKRYSQLSITDVADRHLRAKTDAIADIIRNISEQCAAAVEGLHLAQDELDDESNKHANGHRNHHHRHHLSITDDGNPETSSRPESEIGDSLLTPDGRNSSISSIPPTPDLVHNRSSTSMSMVSSSTMPERASQQYGPGDFPTRIVENDDECAHEAEIERDVGDAETVHKSASRDTMRAGNLHVVA